MTTHDNTPSRFISKIESGCYEIIESGSIILFNKNDKLIFYIEDLLFEVVFQSGDEQSIKSYIDDDNKNKFYMICTGFNNVLGSSPMTPLPILNQNGHDIYFSFVAFNMSGIPYLIYTFYRGDKNE